ncbi:MAG: patatin-like phospholipase family protein, partial [Flavisolibacter sp.]|nr:patatin-like phospholipase family protein [Flavisolibacter sp.]
LIKALYEKEKPDYHCIVGNSTGSLLAPLAAINEYGRMEKAFTDVNQETIFNVNPFKENGEIKPLGALWRIISGKENIGESENLRKRISSFFTEDDYKQIKDSGKTVKVAVVSLTSNAVEYKSTDEYSYTDMVDWIWASANTPLFMSTLEKEENIWVDGGIKENVPIVEGLKYAEANGIRNIDVVVNYPEGERMVCWPEKGGKTNIIPKLLRIIDVFCDEVRISDILSGVLQAKVEDMRIKVYYMNKEEYSTCPKNLLFKKPILENLWQCGYHHPFDTLAVDTISLPGNNMIFLR